MSLALERMAAHRSTDVDNLLLEWYCAKYCERRGIVGHILPVFLGARSPLDVTGLGGNFFAPDPDRGHTTVLQRLPADVTADATFFISAVISSYRSACSASLAM